MNKFMCKENFYIDAGDSIQNNIFRWYVSYQYSNCEKNVEIDGYGIDTIPDDIKMLIIEKEGKWELTSSASKIKIRYLLNKILKNYDSSIFPDNIFYYGTFNQVTWIKNKLIEKGIIENEIKIKKIEKDR